MTTVLLVRHGKTADVGRRVSGRLPGIGLTADGRREARAAAAALDTLGVARIYTSPMQRTAETAHEIASALHHHLEAPDRARPAASSGGPETEPLLNEIDFGDWTGSTFEDLSSSPAWATFNTRPEDAVIPNGEALDAVAERGSRALTAFVARDPGHVIVAVTHGDVIRLTLARLLAMPLGAFRRVAIGTGSITAVRLEGGEPVVTLLNHPPHGHLREALHSS